MPTRHRRPRRRRKLARHGAQSGRQRRALHAGGRSRTGAACERTDACLEVIDSGPGIPAADRERAFDRFYRRAGSPAGGSGLGLAIVRAIAERHGARVSLQDAAGGGLHVTVTLPAVS